jgi:exosortase/archaeosortase family protein
MPRAGSETLTIGRIMEARSVQSSGFRKAGAVVLYLLMFSAVYFSITWLAPDAIMDWLVNLTIQSSLMTSKLIGLSAVHEGQFLTISGFTLSISPECTALSLFAIFIAGVVAYPGHDPKYKVKGIFYGVIILTVFNIFRIIVIALVGAHFSRGVFDVVHGYVFQSSFVVVLCFIWIAWIRRDILSSIPSATFMGVALIGTLGCGLVMWAAMEQYVGALAYVADSLNKAMNPALDITRYNNEIAFGYADELKGFRIYQHVFDSAIFFGLMLASFKGRQAARFLRNVMGGTLIIVVMHLAIILLMGNLLVAGVGNATEWIFRSVSIAVPIILWLWLKKGLAGKEFSSGESDNEAVAAT